MKRSSFNKGWTVSANGGAAREVTLPHDATAETSRSPKAESGRGGAFFDAGVYTYEKTFAIPAECAGERLFLEFEGVYPTAEVFLNGKSIGGCRYGYSTFTVELTGFLAGQENTVKVVADDSKHPNSRWYAGAGIYRPVWLLSEKTGAIRPYGIRITTESFAPAVITVETDLPEANSCADREAIAGKQPAEVCKVLTEILWNGKVVATAEGKHCRIAIPDAKLWNAEEPNLYDCRVTVIRGGETIDVQTERFGIRKLEWSEKGFFVNGQSVKLKGGCIHSDNGILGARSYDASEWRRIKRLKEFGYNAIRSSHNPLCRAALEACDALGMYVLDETWDTWYKPKNPHDFGVEFRNRYETDIEQLVAKDYNHPSVVMYSIGNEITEPAKKEGVQMAEKLVAKVKSLDITRPVTAGVNVTLLLMAKLPFDPMAAFAGGGKQDEADTDAATNTATDATTEQKAASQKQQVSSEQYNKMIQSAGSGMNRVNEGFFGDLAGKKVFSKLDICGYNYGTTRYEREGKKFPHRVVVGTETYCQDICTTWPIVERLPYVIGDFMWTAWDYLGEAGIGGYSYDAEDFSFEKSYPWKLADAGALDILGDDNAEAGLAKVTWEHQIRPYLAATPAKYRKEDLARAVWRGTNARPCWSYQGCDGTEVDVEVYSAADSAEVFVNGKSRGKAKLQDYKALFTVPYEAGELKAYVYDAAGNKLDEAVLASATGEIGIRITQEESCLPQHGTQKTAWEETGTADEILYFAIALTGANDVVEANADRTLTVRVEGGELLAFGSANPKTEEDYLSGAYTTYYGRAQAVVRRTGEKGTITVTDRNGNAASAAF